MHPDKKLIIALSAAVLILSVIIAGLLYAEHPLASGPASAPPMPPVPKSADGLMHGLGGTVVAVNGDTLAISAIVPGAASPVSIKVTVPAGAEITLQTPKDPAALAQEMSLYQEKVAHAASNTPSEAAPPSPFTVKAIAFSDIAVGAFVAITPAANTKEGATAVLAQAVAVQDVPAMPPAAPSPAAQ